MPPPLQEIALRGPERPVSHPDLSASGGWRARGPPRRPAITTRNRKGNTPQGVVNFS
jgi:hypothetical protein